LTVRSDLRKILAGKTGHSGIDMYDVTEILLQYAHRDEIERVEECRQALAPFSDAVSALAGALTHRDDDVRVLLSKFSVQWERTQKLRCRK
jgi:hypothetical protein